MDMQPVVDRPTPSKGELERSLVLAEAAQSKIRTLGLSPTPRTYEICYAYGTRQNRVLNIAIDDLLAAGDPLRESDLERLHATHFPAALASLSKFDSGWSFSERADRYLYAAKRNGRNRVVGTVDSQSLPQVEARVA